MINKRTKIRTCALILFLSVFIPSNAQNMLSLEANLMLPGDSITKERVEFVPAGDDGNQAVWDYSNLEAEGIYSIRFDTISRSQLIGYDMQKTYNYRITNDSLLMTGYESPLLSVEYQKPLLIQPFPLRYGQTYNTDYQGEGRYCGTHFERNFGSVRITADAIGTLILSEKDTLPNTLRVYTINTEAIRLNRDSCRNDSDNLKQVITEHYQWYAPGYRYPVFETVTSSTYDNMNHVATQQYAYRCPPEIQEDMNDSINERIRREQRYEADSHYIHHGKQAPQGKDVGFIYDVEVNGNKIFINYSIEETATIHAMIVDVMGNIYHNVQQTNPAGDNYQINIDCTNLRHGQYIVYINVNGTVYNKKIPVK